VAKFAGPGEGVPSQFNHQSLLLAEFFLNAGEDRGSSTNLHVLLIFDRDLRQQTQMIGCIALASTTLLNHCLLWPALFSARLYGREGVEMHVSKVLRSAPVIANVVLITSNHFGDSIRRSQRDNRFSRPQHWRRGQRF